MDEYGSAHIDNPQDNVANVEINDAEGGFHQGHEQQLERVDLADDDTEANEDRGGHQTSFDDVNEADLDGEVIAHLEETKDNDGELRDYHGDDHSEPDGGQSIFLRRNISH